MVLEYFRHLFNFRFTAWFLRYNIFDPSGIGVRQAWADTIEWRKGYFLQTKAHQWCSERGAMMPDCNTYFQHQKLL
jgi:hypothetical protein